MTSTTTSATSCGSCSMCCKVMAVPELEKPAGTWCVNADPRSTCGGCTIHETRPQVCRGFECVWLQSQSKGNPMHAELRPDRSGVIFTPMLDGKDGLVAHVDPAKPVAHERGHAAALIERALIGGMQVAVVCGDKRKLLIGQRRAA